MFDQLQIITIIIVITIVFTSATSYICLYISPACVDWRAGFQRTYFRHHETSNTINTDYSHCCSLFQITQTLYWAFFGLVDLDAITLIEKHSFTEFAGRVMFGVYSYITVIVLLNMLIAMMNNSYQIISV